MIYLNNNKRNLELSLIGLITLFIFFQHFIGIEIMAMTPLDHNPVFTFFSSAFIHADYIHLGLNSFALFMIGKEFYSIRSLIEVYIGALIISSLFSYLFIHYVHPLAIVGSSGAIFGLFSYIMYRDNRISVFWINVLFIHIIFFILNFPVAWFSHLGGLLFGILFWYLKYKR